MPLAGDQRESGDVRGISRDTFGGTYSTCDSRASDREIKVSPLPNLLGAHAPDVTFTAYVTVVGPEHFHKLEVLCHAAQFIVLSALHIKVSWKLFCVAFALGLHI